MAPSYVSCLRQARMADTTLSTNENIEKSDIRRKKGSKKAKKNWRNKTDIEDVEDYLEDLRRQERTGGVISNKSNAELFFIEKADSEGQLTKEGKLPVSKEDSESEEEENVLTKKEKRRKREQRAKDRKQKQHLLHRPTKDLWSCKEDNDKFSGESWIMPTLHTKPKKPNSIGLRACPTNAVEVCHPGASYNPCYEDHQNLLNCVLREEAVSQKKQEKLDRKLKFLSEEEIKKQPGWLEEMSEGLVQDKDEKSVNDFRDSDVLEDVLSKTVNARDRKGRQLRRKERLQKKEEMSKRESKMENMRLNDIYRLKSLKREIKAKEAALERKRQKRMELKLQMNSKPRRLGKLKYESPKLDFQLSEELSGSLRGLKREGDLLKERIKSFEKRCLVEPRKRVLPHRKYKEKFVDKRSYKKPTIKDFTSTLS